jgi:hypothetical protein
MPRAAEDRIGAAAYQLGVSGEAQGGDWHEAVRKIVIAARANRLGAAAPALNPCRRI